MQMKKDEMKRYAVRWDSPRLPVGGGVTFNLTNPSPVNLQKELHCGTSHSFPKGLDRIRLEAKRLF